MNMIKTVDDLTDALGVHTLLDAVLSKMDDKQALDVIALIIKENGLEVQN